VSNFWGFRKKLAHLGPSRLSVFASARDVLTAEKVFMTTSIASKHFNIFLTVSCCRVCNSNYSKDIKAGNTLPSYDPKKSRLNDNRDNNQAQKVLVYSIRDSGLGKRRLTPAINLVLGDEATKEGTVEDWLKKFRKEGFSLKDFLHVDKSKPYGLSEDSVAALIVDEYNNDKAKEKFAQKAAKRLRSLFPDDKDKFSLQTVQVNI